MPNNNIFSLLKADHRKVESLFAKIEDTTERAVQTRERIYADLKTEITNHSEAEEKVVYPLLKKKEESEDIAFESIEEHGIVKYLLNKLDKTSCDRKEWTAQITALKEVIEHHVEEEEEEMFKKMKNAFSDEELEDMGVQFDEFKQSLLKSAGPRSGKAA